MTNEEKLFDLYNTDTEQVEAIGVYKTQIEVDIDNMILRQNGGSQRWVPSEKEDIEQGR